MYLKNQQAQPKWLTLTYALVFFDVLSISSQVEATRSDQLPWQAANTNKTAVDNKIACAMTKIGAWDAGFQGIAVIVNDTPNRIGIWSISFDADFDIETIWNAKIISHTGNTYIVQATDNNRSLSPGDEVRFGFLGTPSNDEMPCDITLFEATKTTYATAILEPTSTPPIHELLFYNGTGTCLACHENEAHEVHGSTHYQWKGEAPYMIDGNYLLQGKDAGAVNSYCGNIEGNWNGCSNCHVGIGGKPEAIASNEQLENIDCLVCHQSEYRRKKVNGVMIPDTANMSISMEEAVQTVHMPTKANCLACHAKAGGGDAVKRGDIALATANTADFRYDVHMATTGANLECQDCHQAENHRFPGKGSDLRPTDLDKPLECANSSCHDTSPHGNSELNNHTARVACQTCHIPVYAKNANDSAATEATEVNRSWQSGSHSSNPPYHPVLTKQNDLIPRYLHWDRYTDNYNLGETIYNNPETNTYQTSIPSGSVDDADSKLYPFKYKTSDYPLNTNSNMLIPLDTSVFFNTTNADEAAIAGLENMANKGVPGFNISDTYEWVTTDTYQLLNHQVGPIDEALGCESCHLETSRMDLQGELGYAPFDGDISTCSSGCHDEEEAQAWSFGGFDDFNQYHTLHKTEGASCIDCHNFTR
jgi:hypothetical protein